MNRRRDLVNLYVDEMIILMDWINLAKYGVQWRPVVNMVSNGNFLGQLSDCKLVNDPAVCSWLLTRGCFGTGDIWELFSADIRPGHYGAFSRNCAGLAADTPQVRKPRYGAFVNLRHSDLRASNMDKDDCPFATGVFVANLTLWRWHRVAEKMQHWLAVHRR
jgi:hypothetical protein